MKRVRHSYVYGIFAVALFAFAAASSAPQRNPAKSHKTAKSKAGWARVSPIGESFSVALPAKLLSEQLDASIASGWKHSLTNGNVSYTVLSLDNLPGWFDNRDGEPKESLRQIVKETHRQVLGSSKLTIHFQREHDLAKYAGRQYPITTSDGASGLLRVYLIRQRSMRRCAYILVGLGTMADGMAIQRFLDSFTLSSGPEVILTRPPIPRDDWIVVIPSGGSSVIPPCKCSNSQNRGAEICYHPKPTLTPEEEVSGLTGKITLTAELTTGGSVVVNAGSVKMEGNLPDALLQRVIEATRQIRFCPAVVRGRKVPQGISILYEVKESVIK